MSALAGGIDLGGTKIEAQRYGADWTLLDKRRTDTPKSYDALLQAMADQIAWLQDGEASLPVGVAAAGLVSPQTRHSIAANLPSNGRPFMDDLATQTGCKITWLNDCRAFSLAEAVFGAGSQTGTMAGVVLGTGIGGALCVDGVLMNAGAGVSGEFGHLPLAAHLVEAHDLPLVRCGCGRVGCFETLGAGPGLERLAEHLTGRPVSARDVARGRVDDPALARVWEIWCEIIAAMMSVIVDVADPKEFVLGGGLSLMDGVAPALEAALGRVMWAGFDTPAVRLGSCGETAAALGAAYAAHQGVSDE